MGKWHSSEKKLRSQEEQFFLSQVKYDVFWGKVKLAGYTMKLRPEHMRMIAPAIRLDYEKTILSHKYNEEKGVLCDDNFGFENGVHEPQKLLLIGFLYCKFASDAASHMENLWHLINPNFKKDVSLRVLEQTLQDLLYISIDQRLKMLTVNEEGDDKMEQTYLLECIKSKQPFVQMVIDELKGGDPNCTRVTKDTFDRVFHVGFTRPSNLRCYLNKKAQSSKSSAQSSVRGGRETETGGEQ